MYGKNKITPINCGALVKYLVSLEGTTITKLKEKVNARFKKTDTLDNLTKKLRNNRLRVDELAQIADVLGYGIFIQKINPPKTKG